MICDLRNGFCSERLITVTQKRFKGFEIDEVSWELIEEGTDLAREWGWDDTCPAQSSSG